MTMGWDDCGSDERNNMRQAKAQNPDFASAQSGLRLLSRVAATNCVQEQACSGNSSRQA